MSVNLLHALAKQYEGEIAVAEANVAVYLKAPVGIGEHPDVAQALDSQIERYATAKEKYEACYELINDRPQTTLTE